MSVGIINLASNLKLKFPYLKKTIAPCRCDGRLLFSLIIIFHSEVMLRDENVFLWSSLSLNEPKKSQTVVKIDETTYQLLVTCTLIVVGNLGRF